MRFAYADPPYLGCCGIYQHHHPDGRCWDDMSTHVALIERLEREYPDGWALSLHSPSLRQIAQFAPAECRIAAWCKPFAPWRLPKNEEGGAAAAPWTWEPVIYRTVSTTTRVERLGVSCRDFLLESPPLRQRVPGEKPHRFGWWVFSLLGAGPGDEMDDLFPGSGAIGEAWRAWCGEWDATGTLFDMADRADGRSGKGGET